jgi:trk system potassium uptake protein TrkH
MRLRVVGDSLGWILILFSAAFVLPIVTGLAYREPLQDIFLAFGVPVLITLGLGIFLKSFNSGLNKSYSESIRDREALAIVGLGWLLIAFVGALPYVFSNTLPNLIDAYFESMSGFTTTGSTLLEPPAGGDYLDKYSHSILLWRALTQWLGGMGIILLSVVILARILGGGMMLMRAEVPGPSVTRLKPRIRTTAAILWTIYGVFTIAEIVLLSIAIHFSGKGEPFFDAICHTFTTLATGGFSTHSSSIAFYGSVWVEIIIIIFMLIAGTNFVLHYHVLTRKYKDMLNDPEFRFYLLLIFLTTFLITAQLVVREVYSNAGEAFRYGIFQSVSIMTTTGYANTNFGAWPSGVQFLLLLAMFIGGCAGSTGGAVKVIRILILLKAARREVKKVIHPRAVIPIKLAGKPISEPIIHTVIVFFVIYILIFIISAVAISIMGDLDIITASSSVAATLGNVGPGLGGVGPTATYGVVPPAGKIWLSLCMWLGRLEIFAGLMLFFPMDYFR